MKKYYLILTSLFLLTINITINAQNLADSSRRVIIVEYPYEYLPEYLNNVYIGMSLKDFFNVKDSLGMYLTHDSTDMWYGVEEEVEDDAISQVVYKFAREVDSININRPLYQINIVFLESDFENEYLNDKFGLPKRDMDPTENQWVYRTDYDYLLIVRQDVDNQVQIIATIPGTEWQDLLNVDFD